MRYPHNLNTHGATRHSNKRASHGSSNRHQVVDNAFILGVGDICDVEDVAHSVREALQTATGLLGSGYQGRQWGPL